ncbi:hypothetical protein [Comamonas antarctica]|uniref:Glycine zipper n=1 Tax=Comamonas antarctica TaxID=2743470 RepID=A0A6N1X777_9BURK|nr:hypothetical protein [Comamonas antarctica]QKV53650.1 hypothetical protein HUK68_12515 [Comamonas antarctica]
MDDKEKTATGTGAVLGGVAGGVAGGAAAGAAIGGMTGPVGAAVGALAGAAVGALAGKGVANADPVAEDTYWRDNYSTRPYASGASYDEYGPAYRYGVDSYSKYQGRSFDDVDTELSRDWGSTRGTSTLDWDRARPAARDAWQRLSDRVERAVPGDSDRDGK